MALVQSLFEHLEAHEPELVARLLDDGRTLVVRSRLAGEDGAEHALRIEIHEGDDGVLLDWTWRLPLRAGRESAVRGFLLDYVRETVENHGWDVPIVLVGGPRAGQRLTKRREDLVGRLLFARPRSGPDRPAHADLYKWHLRRNDQGEYVCHYERSLEGEALDAFLARGVEDTGPFVLIADTAGSP